MNDFHPLVKQLMDGEITLADLPPELRPQGEEALRLLAAIDRRPIAMPELTQRVMSVIQDRTPRNSFWRRMVEPREIRLRVRPWTLAPTLALAAALVIWLVSPDRTAPSLGNGAGIAVTTVRFTLIAPEAQRVSVAGTFNQWNPEATPLARMSSGAWTGTLSLPAGQHLYAFVVDGARWIIDPAAPAVDDGFGRRNSVLAL
jgi:hypothetical protein